MFGLAGVSHRWIETPLPKGGSEEVDNFVDWRRSNFNTFDVLILLYMTPVAKFISDIGNNILPPISPSLSKVPQRDLYCHLPQSIDTAFEDCLLPKNKSIDNLNIYLIGDSHASNHYWTLIRRSQKENLIIHCILVEDGFINSVAGNDNCPGTDSPCLRNAWRKYMTFFNDTLRANDLIFFSYARDRVNSTANYLPRRAGPSVDALKTRLQEIADIAKSKNAKLILIGDIPKVCRGDVNYDHEILRMRWFESCTVSKLRVFKTEKDCTTCTVN